MPQLSEPDLLWEKVKSELSQLLPSDIYQSWFSDLTCLSIEGETVMLGVQNAFTAYWINDNYLDVIAKCFQTFLGYPVAVAIQNDEVLAEENEISHRNAVESRERDAARAATRRASRTNKGEANLNPRNTFENFVIGSNSQLAHAAAIAVAHAPAGAYNPLFLYGDTGLGKTHLMHAVGHHIHQNNPESRVVYLSSEKFTNEFISAIQENTLPKFRQRYRSVDVLLIDDVQFLSGKERIQEEFFHTFNDLFESQKQIFLSSAPTRSKTKSCTSSPNTSLRISGDWKAL